MAISAIPTGMPAFVSALLSQGARKLADAKAVVKNLADVETLGATSAINTDKTGTLTMNQMMVSTIYANGNWFTVEGDGYRKSGAILSVAGVQVPDFTRLAYGLALDTDATVSDSGDVVGDPTEAALVVLAAKLGVDAEETRRAYPRLAEVPFDSDYKFMATFHRAQIDGAERLFALVKGGPDVVLARCTEAGSPLGNAQVPMDQARADIEAANERLAEKGLRVLAFAARLLDESDLPAMQADPMSFVQGLSFAGMVGIIDPLRAEAKDAVEVALRAGIDVRMITGDHAVTAAAIGESLGLGPGAISGPELQQLTDDELKARLPELHVFGRVTPDDKLRLARVMQETGLIVAMTGDAVNDAAALKQADIGVAMGSGSEVTKQAARMILTDDNFGTLVHAVELGRITYDKIVSFVRVQMSQLLSLVLLFVAATVFNVNEGMALTPSMVLFVGLFIVIFPVIVVAQDPGAPDIMSRPPRDPNVPLTNAAVGVALDPLRRRPLRAGLRLPGLGTGCPEPRRSERLDDDGLRRHRPGRCLRRSRPAPGPGQRPGRSAPQGPRHPRDPRRPHRPCHRAAAAAAGVHDAVADRGPVAGRHRAGPDRPDRRRGRQVDPPTSDPGGGARRCARGRRASSRPPVDHSARNHGEVTDMSKNSKKSEAVEQAEEAAPARGGRTGRRRRRGCRGAREDEGEGVPEGAEAAARRARRPSGLGQGDGRQGDRGLRGPRHGRQGGVIKAITERVSPRVFRVVALPAPTEREKSQMYVQRYMAHFPSAGEVVIFDRSWYNRAGVERVMGFCTQEQTDRSSP